MWGFLSLLVIIRPDYYVLGDTVITVGDGWTGFLVQTQPVS